MEQQSEKQSEITGAEVPAPKKDRYPNKFKKGDPRINRTLGPKPGEKTDRTPQLLRDMRFVYGHVKNSDRTQGQKHCRQWLETDRKGFLSQLSQLEKAKAVGKVEKPVVPGEGKKEPVVVDEGEYRAVELIDRLLGEWSDGREDNVS